jgi:hypothetical protein
VEGARLHAPDVQGREPAAQLPGRARGEGDREDLLGHVDAGVHAVGDAVGDRAGLAGAGTGEDADRPGHGLRSGALLVVQTGEHRLGPRPGVRPDPLHPGSSRSPRPVPYGKPRCSILPAGDDSPGKHPQEGRVAIYRR